MTIVKSTDITPRYRYTPGQLMEFSNQVLAKLKVPLNDAVKVSQCLVEANLKGFDSHGIVRLPVYARRLAAGVVNAQPKLEVLSTSGPLIAIDGDNGLGPVIGVFAMEQTIAAAREWGIGLATVKRSNHFGAAGYYVEQAAARQCIGFVTSNAPPGMVPWGGRERFLGTNPFAIGIPIKGAEPLVIDMASSVVARGRIVLAAQQGERIPDHWAIDPRGLPTTDPKEALLGGLMPFGGPKGAAISLVIDILSGVLSGAAYGRYLTQLEDLSDEQDLGHCFMALEVKRLMDFDAFSQRITDLIQQLKSIPLAPGFAEILAPGELEQRRSKEREAGGIVITQDVLHDLEVLGESIGVRLPPGRPVG